MLSQRTHFPTTALGRSKTIKTGTHGCLVFAYANATGIDPLVLNRRLSDLPAGEGFLEDSAILVHKGLEKAVQGLKITHLLHGYDNDVVKRLLATGHRVVVHVNASKEIQAPMHWVQFLGGGFMYDPWTGKVETTAKYRTYISFVAFTVPGQGTSTQVTPQTHLDRIKTRIGQVIKDPGTQRFYLDDLERLVDDCGKYEVIASQPKTPSNPQLAEKVGDLTRTLLSQVTLGVKTINELVKS